MILARFALFVMGFYWISVKGTRDVSKLNSLSLLGLAIVGVVGVKRKQNSGRSGTIAFRRNVARTAGAGVALFGYLCVCILAIAISFKVLLYIARW